MENELQKKRKETESLKKKYKYIVIILFSISWAVVAFLAIRDLWNGKKLLDSPWPLISLLMTFLLILFILIPLFLDLQKDIRELKRSKEED